MNWKLQVKNVSGPAVWNETIRLRARNQADAEQEARQVVADFNAEETRRYGTRAKLREFVAIEPLEVRTNMCGACGTEMAPKDSRWTCPDCGLIHCQECYRDFRECYDCDTALADEPDTQDKE